VEPDIHAGPLSFPLGVLLAVLQRAAAATMMVGPQNSITHSKPPMIYA